jgi:hypothetical protein
LLNNIYTPSEIESSSILLGLSYLLPMLFASTTALYAFTIPPVFESELNGTVMLLLPGCKQGAVVDGANTVFSNIVLTCLAVKLG